jgi:hypothetical protein
MRETDVLRTRIMGYLDVYECAIVGCEHTIFKDNNYNKCWAVGGHFCEFGSANNPSSPCPSMPLERDARGAGRSSPP